MGGNARWTTAAIRMDGSSKIMMDSGSGNGQQRRNGRPNGETIAMGKVARWEAMQDGWQW